MPTPLHDQRADNRSTSPNGYHDTTTNKAIETSPNSTPTVPGYEVLGEISRSEKGSVYRARDTTLGNEVAIKVPAFLESGSSPTTHYLRRSAALVCTTEAPESVPPIYDLGTLPDGRPFLAMKLIKGSILADILAERPKPIADRIRFLSVFEQICQAIAFAHAQRAIHRDLKPHHVMIGSFGEVFPGLLAGVRPRVWRTWNLSFPMGRIRALRLTCPPSKHAANGRQSTNARTCLHLVEFSSKS